MNEFTKQELEDIRDCIDYAYRSNPISPRISLTLRNKIQSMIDNYCEHESDGKDYCPGLYDRGDRVTIEYALWPLCDKCKKSGYDYHLAKQGGDFISLCKDCYKEEMRKNEPL